MKQESKTLKMLALVLWMSSLRFASAACARIQTIEMSGSTTVFPLAQSWSQAFLNVTSCFNTTIRSTETSAGAREVCNAGDKAKGEHKVDIGDMSRRFTSSEARLMSDGYTYQCAVGDVTRKLTLMVIARDGIVLTTGLGTLERQCVENMEGLTLAQLRWIFSDETDAQLTAAGLNLASVIPNDDKDGIKEWSDLRTGCIESEIHTYGVGGGTFDTFANAICNHKCGLSKRTKVFHDQEQVIQSLTSDNGGIGFTSFHVVQESTENVAPVRVAGDVFLGALDTPLPFVTPSVCTVVDGSYSLSRNIFMIVDNGQWPKVEPFIRFIYSNEGHDIATTHGYHWSPHLSDVMLRRVGGNSKATFKTDEIRTHSHGDVATSVALAMTVIGTVIVGFFAQRTFALREHPILTVSSLPMLSVVLLGSLMATFIPVVLSIAPQSDTTCNISWWMLHVALGCVFGSLTAKNAQLRHLFEATTSIAQLQTGPLLKILGGVGLSVIGTCSLASGIGIHAVARVTFVMDGTAQKPPLPWSIKKQELWCDFQSDATAAFCFVPHLALLVYSMYWLQRTKSIPSFVNETQYIGSSLFVVSIVIVILFVAQSQISSTMDQFLIINSLGIIFAVVCVDMLIFLPKLFKVYDKTFDFKLELQEGIRYRTALQLARSRFRLFRETGVKDNKNLQFEVSQDVASLFKSSDEEHRTESTSEDRIVRMRAFKNQNIMAQLRELNEDHIVHMAQELLRNLGYFVLHPGLSDNRVQAQALLTKTFDKFERKTKGHASRSAKQLRLERLRTNSNSPRRAIGSSPSPDFRDPNRPPFVPGTSNTITAVTRAVFAGNTSDVDTPVPEPTEVEVSSQRIRVGSVEEGDP